MTNLEYQPRVQVTFTLHSGEVRWSPLHFENVRQAVSYIRTTLHRRPGTFLAGQVLRTQVLYSQGFVPDPTTEDGKSNRLACPVGPAVPLVADLSIADSHLDEAIMEVLEAKRQSQLSTNREAREARERRAAERGPKIDGRINNGGHLKTDMLGHRVGPDTTRKAASNAARRTRRRKVNR